MIEMGIISLEMIYQPQRCVFDPWVLTKAIINPFVSLLLAIMMQRVMYAY